MANAVKSITKFILVAAVVLSAFADAQQLGCRNPNGDSVDWFVVLKMPRIIDGDGVAYNYADSDSNGVFTYYNDVNDVDTSPVMQTLFNIQDVESEDYASVFWNDQTSDGQSHSSFAHAKGIAASDAEQGFILVHSLPKFPNFTGYTLDLEIPSTSHMYGQHFFCITVSSSTLNDYARALQVDHVYTVPESYLPSSLESELYNLGLVVAHKQTSSANTLEVNFESVGGTPFTKFAKNPKYEAPLYAVAVAPFYDLPFQFETWGNGGAGLSPADCDYDPQVFSTLEISMENAGVEYAYSDDHSKYGASIGGSVTCFGDLNRQETQNRRGGGTVCFEDDALHASISSFFVKRQTCRGDVTDGDDDKNGGSQSRTEIFFERFFHAVEQVFEEVIDAEHKSHHGHGHKRQKVEIVHEIAN